MNPYIQYMYSYPHKTAYRPLSGISLKDYAQALSGAGHGLYLHIPFCQSKCGYCNLFSVTGAGEEDADRYLNGVERQARQYQQILTSLEAGFSEFTIGGGTPLFLTEKQLERVFAIVHECFGLEKGAQVIIETAPNQTAENKLKRLKEAGVTRVSMGIQSFSKEELKTLKRGHSVEKALEALECLQAFDFPCVNIDFIYGIPGQTVKSLLMTLKRAITFAPDEIFLYPLYVKHGAGLEKELEHGMVLDPEKAYIQYQEASDFLKSEGFRQDSMRRFVNLHVSSSGRTSTQKRFADTFDISELRLPDGDETFRVIQAEDSTGFQDDFRNFRTFSECGFGTSLALGCGGRSYLGNLHFCTPYAITQKDCLEELRKFEATQDFTKIIHGFLLSREEEKRRYVIRHLLIRPGIDTGIYEKRFGSRVQEDFPMLSLWQENGFLTWETREKTSYIILTDQGMGLSDYLGPQLISRQVQERMEEWEHVHKQTYGSLSGQLKKL